MSSLRVKLCHLLYLTSTIHTLLTFLYISVLSILSVVMFLTFLLLWHLNFAFGGSIKFYLNIGLTVYFKQNLPRLHFISFFLSESLFNYL